MKRIEILANFERLDQVDRILDAFAAAVSGPLVQYWGAVTLHNQRTLRHTFPAEIISTIEGREITLGDYSRVMARRTIRSFTYDEARRALTIALSKQRADELNQLRADIGMRDGLCVPFFGPNGFRSLITMAGPIGAAPFDSPDRVMIVTYARAAQAALCSACQPDLVNCPMAKLSPREAECLELVATGKADSEIGPILGISPHTAHEYIGSALNKLGAVSRAQGIAVATVLEEIRVSHKPACSIARCTRCWPDGASRPA